MPTVELCLPDKKAIYINFEKYWSRDKEKAEAHESYNIAPIQIPTDWMLALTRFHLPMSRVPMQEEIPNAMTLAHPVHTHLVLNPLIRTFSIAQLLQYLNYWARIVVSQHTLLPANG